MKASDDKPTRSDDAISRVSRLLIPAALVVFAGVASANFQGLPEQVPIHFNASGAADRFVERRQFIGLCTMTAVLLGGVLLFARVYVATEKVADDHVYARFPHLRRRVARVLDVLGAAGLSLVTWVSYLCARAAEMDEPAVPRRALMLPLAVLLVGAVGAALWTRPIWRETPREKPASQS